MNDDTRAVRDGQIQVLLDTLDDLRAAALPHVAFCHRTAEAVSTNPYREEINND